MIDLMLRFPDEATAAKALADYRGDGWVLASHGHAMDVIGPVTLAQAVIDAETGEVTKPADLDSRFHVNLRILSGSLPAGIEPYIVAPANPARVWA